MLVLVWHPLIRTTDWPSNPFPLNLKTQLVAATLLEIKKVHVHGKAVHKGVVYVFRALLGKLTEVNVMKLPRVPEAHSTPCEFLMTTPDPIVIVPWTSILSAGIANLFLQLKVAPTDA